LLEALLQRLVAKGTLTRDETLESIAVAAQSLEKALNVPRGEFHQ